jgi:hypothetical protein
MRAAEIEVPEKTAPIAARTLRLLTIAAILLGAVIRIGVVGWTDPWDTHHPDEHILPLEAVALWEGITPREVGWPGSTTRLIHSLAAAVQCAVEEGGAMWAERDRPDRALAIVSTWIGRRYVAPQPLYRMGRTISVITGTLQLLAVAWALSQWVGPIGTLIGTLAMALSPVAVAHSQYVLADITGLLFGTIALGLAARPTPRRAIAMAALVGLAAASKFHFGLWITTPLLCVVFGDREVFGRKLLLSMAVAATTACVVVALVPWFVTNPLLALKEFVGVVLVKVGRGSPLVRIPSHVTILFGAFGAMGWVGVLASGGHLRGEDRRRFAPVAVPFLLATAALLLSATVFDRYAMVLLPGAAILAGLGWDESLRHPRATIRMSVAVGLALCLVATIVSLVYSQRVIGEADVDVLARNWIVANVPPGSRVAVHDEMNAYLPRAADDLRACAEHVITTSAYEEKWLVEGVKTSVADAKPMESMVLNDEQFAAFWCRRELGVGNPSGFHVVTYHYERRFGAVLERDAIEAFRTGAQLSTGQVDVLVTNRPIDVGMPPVQILKTARGGRVIYRRSPVPSRSPVSK